MALILIVEDELLTALEMQFTLERAGHEVQLAADGRQALEALQLLPVNLVITDYMMPTMDGAELLRLLRAGDWAGPVKALLITALPPEQLDGRVAGHDLYLKKPVPEHALLHAVEQLLNER